MKLAGITLLDFIKLAELEGFKSCTIPSVEDKCTHYENMKSFIDDESNNDLGNGITILKLVTEESNTTWESVPLSSMKSFKNSLKIILDTQIYKKYIYTDLTYKYLIENDHLKIISIRDNKVVGSFELSLIMKLNHYINNDDTNDQSHFYVPLLNDESTDISKVIKYFEI